LALNGLYARLTLLDQVEAGQSPETARAADPAIPEVAS
jgi:hypothetical protein